MFVNEARDNAGAHPVALVAMDIGVTLRGGLAVVETKRTFRNDEKTPIEALLSLPVPVHAAFFGLTANIDGRILKGIAQAQWEARETYEEAINEGKTAVLHEELLCGVHALSVGNLAAGGVIEVTTCWADTLRSSAASRGRLRIPMTVGDGLRHILPPRNGRTDPWRRPEERLPAHPPRRGRDSSCDRDAPRFKEWRSCGRSAGERSCRYRGGRMEVRCAEKQGLGRPGRLPAHGSG